MSSASCPGGRIRGRSRPRDADANQPDPWWHRSSPRVQQTCSTRGELLRAMTDAYGDAADYRARTGPPLAGQARRMGAQTGSRPEHGAAARLRRPTRHAVAAGTTAPAGQAGPLPAVAGRGVGVPFSAGALPARARPPVTSAETSRHANVAAASRGYVPPMSHATVPWRRPRRAHRFVDRRQA